MSLVIEMHPVNFVLEILQIHIIIIINNAFENALHRDLKALYIAKLKSTNLNTTYLTTKHNILKTSKILELYYYLKHVVVNNII